MLLANQLESQPLNRNSERVSLEKREVETLSVMAREESGRTRKEIRHQADKTLEIKTRRRNVWVKEDSTETSSTTRTRRPMEARMLATKKRANLRRPNLHPREEEPTVARADPKVSEEPKRARLERETKLR